MSGFIAFLTKMSPTKSQELCDQTDHTVKRPVSILDRKIMEKIQAPNLQNKVVKYEVLKFFCKESGQSGCLNLKILNFLKFFL